MSSDKRSFFRFDVTLPYYLEAMNEDGICFHINRATFIQQGDEKQIQSIKTSIDFLFQDKQHIQNGGVQIFRGLNDKIEFMAWLLDAILLGRNVLSTDEFHERLNVNKRFTLPESKGSSKVLPLLQALSKRLDHYIDELVSVMQNSLRNKVFFYHKKPLELFNILSYLKGLEDLAKKRNWLAMVITSLVSLLNVYEARLVRVKTAYQSISDTENWDEESVNLGAGGFAIYSAEPFAINQKFCALFKVDNEFVFGQASCVNVSQEACFNGKHRVAFKFEDITAEDSAHIVRYLMTKELEFHQMQPK
ncbi:PilZ domain-containing protein [Thiomicrorhabdus sp. Kp2]|uniref:PilZ domain-containing protein n=1 Tax=Thiomicrorhabdus sp. Kp2 TaxID=1123518 RepID=UPI000594B3E6|nr:PilZ domain-containing protein [Thiomicrorhabdus sp. Kp2]